MALTLVRASLADAELIWEMQKQAFAPLLDKYQDMDTNPAAEPLSRVIMRLKQPFTYYYLIQEDGCTAGAIRIVDKQEPGKRKRISPCSFCPSIRGAAWPSRPYPPQRPFTVRMIGNWTPLPRKPATATSMKRWATAPRAKAPQSTIG